MTPIRPVSRAAFRTVALLAFGALVVVACGATATEDTSGATDTATLVPQTDATEPETTEPETTEPETTEPDATEPETTEPETTEPEDAASADTPASPGDFPDLEVINVASGETVQLTDLAADERPTLLWMWAPH